MTFAVLPDGAEYHPTRDDDRRGVRADGASPQSWCGAHVGLASRAGGSAADAEPSPRLYDKPPPGLTPCRACVRLMSKRKGWARLLSHLLHHKGGFRSGVKSLGRLT